MDKLLEYFFEEPEKEFYVRELARVVKKSPTTISKYLNNLKKENLLVSKRKFNHLLFKANTESKKFIDLKIMENLKKIRESGLLEYLNNEFNNPQAIILFGSFAKGENIQKSDVDMLVITPSKKELNLEGYNKYLGHKIHLFLFSEKEINQMKDKNKELINNFINGIVLDGYWELLK